MRCVISRNSSLSILVIQAHCNRSKNSPHLEKAKARYTFRGASASRQTACRGFAARGGCPPAKVHATVSELGDETTADGGAETYALRKGIQQ